MDDEAAEKKQDDRKHARKLEAMERKSLSDLKHCRRCIWPLRGARDNEQNTTGLPVHCRAELM